MYGFGRIDTEAGVVVVKDFLGLEGICMLDHYPW